MTDLIDKYFPVLDYGFVALKDYMGSDQSIEQAARVSYQGGTRKSSDTRNLLRYLMRHAHTSPFEMVELQFHMSMPIFVARQIVRHRTVNLNEVSGRYSVLPTIFYTPKQENLTRQSTTNKQGRDDVTFDEIEYDNITSEWYELRKESAEVYDKLLNMDVSRELARIDLPLSTYTQWYWKIDLHNLFHFLKLRLDPHAQWETRQYARVMAGIVKEICPISFEAFLDYKLYSKSFAYNELQILQMISNGHRDYNDNEIREIAPSYSLSKREIEEFISKLRIPERENFTLDQSLGKDGQYFQDLIKQQEI